MNSIALLKRVLPFFAGLAIGLIPSWIFTAADGRPVMVTSPTFAKSKSYCDGTGKYRQASESGKLKIISKPLPGYTSEAREENVEGKVILRVEFLASGDIGSIRPVTSLGGGLTEQAIEAARRIEFEPAIEHGQPVTISKQIEYSFSIL